MKYKNYNNIDKIVYEVGDWVYRKINKKYINGRDCILEFVFKINKITGDFAGNPVFWFDSFNCVNMTNKSVESMSGYFKSADGEFRLASQKEIDEAAKIIENAKKMPKLEIAGHQVEFEINPDGIYESRITIGCKTLTYGRILTIRGTMVDYGITGLRVTGKGGKPFIISFAEVEDLISILDRARLNPSPPPPSEHWKFAPTEDIPRRSV